MLLETQNHHIIMLSGSCKFVGYIFAIIFHFFSSVSKCGETEASSLFHEEDQILAVNDLLTDTVEV